MRQIVLDTETTGLEPQEGHRIIEIGGVELLNRRPTGRTFHQYLNPDRRIDEGAIEVHGITNEMLVDKPRFADVAADFIEFVDGAELVIHNAGFDISFLNAELEKLGEGHGDMSRYCTVLDTLAMARKLHPGQKNNLDALCKRYGVNNEHRELHGALLDAEILADVYLAMTGGQTSLSLGANAAEQGGGQAEGIRRLDGERPALKVVRANDEELAAHREYVERLEKKIDGESLWREIDGLRSD